MNKSIQTKYNELMKAKSVLDSGIESAQELITQSQTKLANLNTELNKLSIADSDKAQELLKEIESEKAKLSFYQQRSNANTIGCTVSRDDIKAFVDSVRTTQANTRQKALVQVMELFQQANDIVLKANKDMDELEESANTIKNSYKFLLNNTTDEILLNANANFLVPIDLEDYQRFDRLTPSKKLI